MRTNEDWAAAGERGEPAWCYYDNDSENGKIYGKLYNWYAVNDARGLAPKGWHIPTDDEWTTLDFSLGFFGKNTKQEFHLLQLYQNYKILSAVTNF